MRDQSKLEWMVESLSSCIQQTAGLYQQNHLPRYWISYYNSFSVVVVFFFIFWWAVWIWIFRSIHPLTRAHAHTHDDPVSSYAGTEGSLVQLNTTIKYDTLRSCVCLLLCLRPTESGKQLIQHLHGRRWRKNKPEKWNGIIFMCLECDNGYFCSLKCYACWCHCAKQFAQRVLAVTSSTPKTFRTNSWRNEKKIRVTQTERKTRNR